jgi:hypothetical protein
VGIVLGEAPDAGEAVQYAAALVAVDRPILGVAFGQITVRAHLALKDLDVEGTVHGLGIVILTLDVHRRVHVLGVEV